jgi:hypothetical protein
VYNEQVRQQHLTDFTPIKNLLSGQRTALDRMETDEAVLRTHENEDDHKLDMMRKELRQ